MQHKTLSLVIFLSFLCLIASSLVLYTWEFAGLGKKVWTDLHITGGLLFITAGLWHTLVHIKTVLRYIAGNKKIGMKGFVPLTFAVLLTVGVYTTTFLNISPMRQVLELYEMLKTSHSKGKQSTLAETITLKAFCKEFGLDPIAAVASLQASTGLQNISLASSFFQVEQESGMPPALLAKKLLMLELAPEKATH